MGVIYLIKVLKMKLSTATEETVLICSKIMLKDYALYKKGQRVNLFLVFWDKHQSKHFKAS